MLAESVGQQRLKHRPCRNWRSTSSGSAKANLPSRIARRCRLERRRGDLDAAIRLFIQVLAELREVDDYSMVFDMHLALYESYKLHGDFGNALKHHEAVLQRERELMKQRADRQVRLLLHRIELEHAQATAERAKLDAELQRRRATRLESENKQLAVQAKELGRHALEDQLTGLANRRRVDRKLPAQLALAKDRNGALCVAGIDLDHFKLVNDRFGHTAGDDVLRAIARILPENTRSSDVFARMGGEEFLVLFIGTPLDIASDICERLRHAVESHDWSAVVAGCVSPSVWACAMQAAAPICAACSNVRMRRCMQPSGVGAIGSKWLWLERGLRVAGNLCRSSGHRSRFRSTRNNSPSHSRETSFDR